MTQGIPAVAERAPQVGEAIGHYRLIGVVGDGSLGRLYVAEQRKIRDVSNTVALRCIRADLARQPGFRSLFAAASSVLPRLEHPNILSIHEMDEVEGSYFLSMEYLPGENVASILTKCNTGSPVPPDIAAAIVKQAANAVQYARELAASAGGPVELACGELDPSNLFVTYHGTVKWLAAGLQAPTTGQGPASSGEHPVNWSSHAAAFRAPEQSQGSSDARADLFNLGGLLWTFLTGHRPQLAYGGESDVAALGRGVAPSSVQPDVPEALDVIVMRALSPQPGRRFQSIRELSEALDRYLLQRDGRPTHKHMRRWMGQLFDAERAAMQLQIARGRDVGAALASLASLQGGGAPSTPGAGRRARELWSTRHSMFARPERTSFELGTRPLLTESPAVSERELCEAPATHRAVSPALELAPASSLGTTTSARPPTWLVAAVSAFCLALAAGTALIFSFSDHRSPLREGSRDAPLAERHGQLEVRSSPEGAAVFVNGEPTGLRTPTVLRALAPDRSLRLRVEKAGYGSQEREVSVTAGAVVSLTFELLASAGLVNFVGAPSGAILFVDDASIAPNGKPVRLSVGRHAVRVEARGSLIFSGTVVVVSGEQTIRVDGAATTP